jgi:hypothetical protein
MAIDTTASTAYAGTRYAPRPGAQATRTRTCAQGSDAQVRYIADLTRDIHATRIAQVRTAHATHGAAGNWDDATVSALLATLGTAEDAIARQMAQPLVYSTPDRPGTIDTLKGTLTRERAQLRAQTPVATPSAPAAALQADQTYRAADGRVIRVVMGGSGHLYGKVWTPDTQSFEYLPGLLRVPGMVLMSLQEVQEFGQQTGQCCVCCTPLTDTVSIALGIGPVCESKYTGRARSRSAKYRASVLAEYAARIAQQDTHTEADMIAEQLAVDTADCPF